MIQTKYLLIIGAIICLIIIYYFYDEISRVKKLYIPVYHKAMSLELDMNQLKKEFPKNKSRQAHAHTPASTNANGHKTDSTALEITYRSDIEKNGDISVKYAELSESEASLIRKTSRANSKSASRSESISELSMSSEGKSIEKKSISKSPQKSTVNTIPAQVQVQIQKQIQKQIPITPPAKHPPVKISSLNSRPLPLAPQFQLMPQARPPMPYPPFPKQKLQPKPIDLEGSKLETIANSEIQLERKNDHLEMILNNLPQVEASNSNHSNPQPTAIATDDVVDFV